MHFDADPVHPEEVVELSVIRQRWAVVPKTGDEMDSQLNFLFRQIFIRLQGNGRQSESDFLVALNREKWIEAKLVSILGAIYRDEKHIGTGRSAVRAAITYELLKAAMNETLQPKRCGGPTAVASAFASFSKVDIRHIISAVETAVESIFSTRDGKAKETLFMIGVHFYKRVISLNLGVSSFPGLHFYNYGYVGGAYGFSKSEVEPLLRLLIKRTKTRTLTTCDVGGKTHLHYLCSIRNFNLIEVLREKLETNLFSKAMQRKCKQVCTPLHEFINGEGFREAYGIVFTQDNPNADLIKFMRWCSTETLWSETGKNGRATLIQLASKYNFTTGRLFQGAVDAIEYMVTRLVDEDRTDGDIVKLLTFQDETLDLKRTGPSEERLGGHPNCLISMLLRSEDRGAFQCFLKIIESERMRRYVFYTPSICKSCMEMDILHFIATQSANKLIAVFDKLLQLVGPFETLEIISSPRSPDGRSIFDYLLQLVNVVTHQPGDPHGVITYFIGRLCLRELSDQTQYFCPNELLDCFCTRGTLGVRMPPLWNLLSLSSTDVQSIPTVQGAKQVLRRIKSVSLLVHSDWESFEYFKNQLFCTRNRDGKTCIELTGGQLLPAIFTILCPIFDESGLLLSNADPLRFPGQSDSMIVEKIVSCIRHIFIRSHDGGVGRSLLYLFSNSIAVASTERRLALIERVIHIFAQEYDWRDGVYAREDLIGKWVIDELGFYLANVRPQDVGVEVEISLRNMCRVHSTPPPCGQNGGRRRGRSLCRENQMCAYSRATFDVGKKLSAFLIRALAFRRWKKLSLHVKHRAATFYWHEVAMRKQFMTKVYDELDGSLEDIHFGPEYYKSLNVLQDILSVTA